MTGGESSPRPTATVRATSASTAAAATVTGAAAATTGDSRDDSAGKATVTLATRQQLYDGLRDEVERVLRLPNRLGPTGVDYDHESAIRRSKQTIPDLASHIATHVLDYRSESAGRATALLRNPGLMLEEVYAILDLMVGESGDPPPAVDRPQQHQSWQRSQFRPAQIRVLGPPTPCPPRQDVGVWRGLTDQRDRRGGGAANTLGAVVQAGGGVGAGGVGAAPRS